MIKTHSISEYIQMNQLRKSLYWRMADGKCEFLHHETGIWFDETMYNKMYPKYEYEPFNPKGENINKKIFQGL